VSSELEAHSWLTRWTIRGRYWTAELVAFRVAHDDVFGSRFLDLLENCGAKLPERGDLAVAVVRAGVQIKVQSVLELSGSLLSRIAWLPDRVLGPACPR
jgi:hypothetical protein